MHTQGIIDYTERKILSNFFVSLQKQKYSKYLPTVTLNRTAVSVQHVSFPSVIPHARINTIITGN